MMDHVFIFDLSVVFTITADTIIIMPVMMPTMPVNAPNPDENINVAKAPMADITNPSRRTNMPPIKSSTNAAVGLLAILSHFNIAF
jgi:hypothetical protein